MQNIKLRSGEILKIREIPEGHKIEYLARSMEEDKFYVVHAPHITEETLDKFPDYYGSFGLYVGSPNNMQEAQVESVGRLRDGGTTIISYILENKDGQLYFPAHRNKRRKRSDRFNGKTVELEQSVEVKDS